MEMMEKLNQFSRKPLTEEEVYCFDVILCDNDIDRDLECFSESALEQMQKLFVGKTGIFDHNTRSSCQTARIYDTSITAYPEKRTKDGRPYKALKANAYMIRTDSNADLIREIDGGIKKEVSVSCHAGKKTCSVCGADRMLSACTHIPGRTYGNKTCHMVLDEITDAYEWSFVAVPAQIQAGVTKQYGLEDEKMEQKAYSEQEILLKDVEDCLRAEVMQLLGKRQSGCISKALCMAAEKMELRELLTFKQELLAEQCSGAQVQLAAAQENLTAFCMKS